MRAPGAGHGEGGEDPVPGAEGGALARFQHLGHALAPSHTRQRGLQRIGTLHIVHMYIKGIVPRDEYFFKAYNNTVNRYFLYSIHALIVFTIIYFLVNEKIKLKVLACSFEVTY